VLLPRQQAKLARGAKDKEHAMSQTPNTAIAVIGIDIGKNSFHVVGATMRAAPQFQNQSALRICATTG
jgi:transposase